MGIINTLHFFLILIILLIMKCSFCDLPLHSYIYACACDDSVMGCRRCYQYGCYQCKAPLQKVQLKMCRKCHQYKMPKYMFGSGYDMYCHGCCLKQYEKSSNKKVILSYYSLEPDKYQLFCYLKKYCYACSTPLANEHLEDQSPGLKQIYPLTNKICQKCIQNTIKSEMSSQVKFSNVHPSSESKASTSARSKPAIYQTNIQNTSEKKDNSKQKFKQDAEDKWKRIQQSPYIRCMVCDRMIIGEGTVNEDVAICNMCTRGSKLEQSLNDSRTKTNSKYQNRDSKINSTADNTGTTLKCYDLVKNVRKQSNGRSDSPKVYEYRDSSKTPEKKKHTQAQNGSARVSVFPPPKQSTLRKSDSQTKLENIPTNIELINDSELVECPRCGIRLEKACAIWEENENVPMCRCCYTELLQQRQQQKKQYQRQKTNKIQYQRYTDKNREPPQNQKPDRNVGQQRQLKQVQRKRQLKSSPNFPNFGMNKQSEPSKDTQPLIKQQTKKEPLNKVKRTQSWDDAIIMEPVADHEKRKREKKLSEQESNRINEQPEQYAPSSPQSEQFKSSMSNQKQASLLNMRNANLKTNFDSQQKPRLIKEDSVEPTIIDDEEQTLKKIQRMESWDQRIILQPLNETKTRKTKSNIPEVNQDQNIRSKDKTKVKENYQQINKKQQVEPIIIEQKKQKKIGVNRLSSWNDQIVLQPVKDHQQRKREKAKQQSIKEEQNNMNPGISNEKQANNKQQISRNTHSETKPKAQSQNRYQSSKGYDQMRNVYRQATEKLKESNANTSYTSKQSTKDQNTNGQRKPNQNVPKTGSYYYTTSQPHTPTRQTDNYSKREQFSKYFKEENQNRSKQKYTDTYTRSPTFKERFDDHFSSRSPFSSYFDRDDEFDKFFSEADLRFKSRLNEPPFFTQNHAKPTYYEMKNPQTSSNTRTESFARQASEGQRGLRQICGHCNKQYSISSRSYRINNVPVCLDCYGEWNRNSKASTSAYTPYSYYYK